MVICYGQILWQRWASSCGATSAAVERESLKFKQPCKHITHTCRPTLCVSHTHINTNINHSEDLSLICIWRLYPTLPQFTPIYYNSIFPVFQSKDLFLLLSLFFLIIHKQERDMSLGDYAAIFGVSSWLHQRNLIWLGRNPLFQCAFSFDLPAVLISSFVRKGWSWWIWSEKRGWGGLGERIIIFNDENKKQ